MNSNRIQSNEFKESIHEQLKKIRKAMQDMKEEFNKDIEILKKNQIKREDEKRYKLKA
jgi:hypothetical protein